MGCLKISIIFLFSLLILSLTYASSLENGANVEVANLSVNEEQDVSFGIDQASSDDNETEIPKLSVSLSDNGEQEEPLSNLYSSSEENSANDEQAEINVNDEQEVTSRSSTTFSKDIETDSELVSSNEEGKVHEKSFKASCVNGLNVNGVGYTCIYSMVIGLLTATQESATITITINGDDAEYEVYNLSTTQKYIIDFTVHPEDDVLIRVSTTGQYYYSVYNAANTEGFVSDSITLNGDVILSSTSTTFELYNSCTSTCILSFSSPQPGTTWGLFSNSVKIYINGVLTTTFNGFPTTSIPISAGQKIIYEAIGTITPGQLQLTSSLDSALSKWVSGLYYSPAVVPNSCAQPFRSPFGGPLTIISQDQVNQFLFTVTLPTTRKVLLTVPSFFTQ